MDKKQYLQAMQLIKQDDWNGAHNIIEKMETPMGSHIHAYLHRIEGDDWNADYWYRRSGKKRPNCGLDEEWIQISALIDEM